MIEFTETEKEMLKYAISNLYKIAELSENTHSYLVFDRNDIFNLAEKLNIDIDNY